MAAYYPPSAPSSTDTPSLTLYIDIFSPVCDDVDCKEDAKYEKNITVRDMRNQPFTFLAFFCEKHKDKARTPWDDTLVKDAPE
jgi:hypothetical protein